MDRTWLMELLSGTLGASVALPLAAQYSVGASFAIPPAAPAAPEDYRSSGAARSTKMRMLG